LQLPKDVVWQRLFNRRPRFIQDSVRLGECRLRLGQARVLVLGQHDASQEDQGEHEAMHNKRLASSFTVVHDRRELDAALTASP
jgi:hypothetical protein